MTAIHDDGSLEVSFVISQGGGCETYTYLPVCSDIVWLGAEADFGPILNCYGEDVFRRLRAAAEGDPIGEVSKMPRQRSDD